MGISQQYVVPMVPGLAGIPYGMGIMPQLNGINYTPMGEVLYTPMNGINYTPEMSGADFGSVDYGGSGGTQVQKPGDFGAGWSLDSEADYGDEDPVDSAMN